MEKYLITGATGYIGSMLIKHLFLQKNNDIEITALVRNIDKAHTILPSEVRLICADLTDDFAMKQIRGRFDYIFHCASITQSSEMVAHPTKVIESIVNSTQNVLELAKRCQAKSVVYLSSMEVYGNIDCSDEGRVTEEQLGELDILNVRSCYPLAKRMAENICYCYYKEYGISVKIARLAQTFGAGLLPGESRVFAQFARAALRGCDIVLHTTGKSMGNYCDIQDAVEALVLILKQGIDGEAYNVVNENNTMTIREVAELVAEKIADNKIQVQYEIPEQNIYGYAKDTGLRLSSAKLQSLGWKPKKKLEAMFRDVMWELERRKS